MRWISLTLLLSASALLAAAVFVSVSVSAASGTRTKAEGLPAWLKTRDRALLTRCFLSASPRRVDEVVYPRKIAVVFEFRPPVVTKTCMPPGRLFAVHVSFLRASFERRVPHDPAAPFLVCSTLAECSYH